VRNFFDRDSFGPHENIEDTDRFAFLSVSGEFKERTPNERAAQCPRLFREGTRPRLSISFETNPSDARTMVHGDARATNAIPSDARYHA